MKGALVTGASGFLGSRLVATLRSQGVAVRALVRPTSDLGRLRNLGAEIVRGDLSDLASLYRAALGCSVVFHTAAKVPDWGSRDEYFRANLEGTKNLLAACQEAGVGRLIHVSSLTVLGLPRLGAAVNEQSPYTEVPGDAYTASKIASEKLVRASHGVRGLATVVLRPGAIWGPGDPAFLPRLGTLLRKGRMMYVGHANNTLALSHVDNLSMGALLAAVAPEAAGQVYHLTDGELITARTAIDGVAEAMGARLPRRSLPFSLAYALASLLEAAARLSRRKRPPLLTRYGVRLVASDCRYNNEKAERELGYRPIVSFRQGLAGLGADLRNLYAASSS